MSIPKLLSFQPVSLYRNGGASRVLRRLYSGRERQVTSVAIKEDTQAVLAGDIHETIINAYPLQRPWMRWKLRNLVIWLRETALINYTIAKISLIAASSDYDILHLICHGPYTMAVYEEALRKGKKLWVSFHDHFAAAGTTFEDTLTLWNNAHRRLVISKQMGNEYSRLFGAQPYEIITDGIMPGEFSAPRPVDASQPVAIYFSGLLHNEYHPLFMVLADALDELANDGITYRLIMRGTQSIPFLNGRSFVTEYRTDFVSDEAIKKEMDAASILYLPIKFNDKEFYLYSLSTKMVGYLGASGSILYHGPADSAACQLLTDAQAAISCTSLTVTEMTACIKTLVANQTDVSVKAKILANKKFDLLAIKKQFWQE